MTLDIHNVDLTGRDLPWETVGRLDALEERAGVEIAIPVLSDEDGRIAEICGIDTQTRRSRMPKAKTFVIGPDLRILAVSAYAAAVRRSPQELLRMLAAMRAAGADA